MMKLFMQALVLTIFFAGSTAFSMDCYYTGSIGADFVSHNIDSDLLVAAGPLISDGIANAHKVERIPVLVSVTSGDDTSFYQLNGIRKSEKESGWSAGKFVAHYDGKNLETKLRAKISCTLDSAE